MERDVEQLSDALGLSDAAAAEHANESATKKRRARPEAVRERDRQFAKRVYYETLVRPLVKKQQK